MAIALVDHKPGWGMSNPTAGMANGGANFLAVGIGFYNALFSGTTGITVADSLGNTNWSQGVAKNDGNGIVSAVWGCKNATVGAGQTVTITSNTGYFGFSAASFSGVDTSAPFDQSNNASGGTTSQQPGSITPSANGALVLSTLSSQFAGAASVNSSLTILDQNSQDESGGVKAEGMAFGYYVQPTAGAINPTWSWSGSSGFTDAVIASYLAATGGGGGTRPVKMVGIWGGYVGDGGGFAA